MDFLRGISTYVVQSSLISILNAHLKPFLGERKISRENVVVKSGDRLVVNILGLKLHIPDSSVHVSIRDVEIGVPSMYSNESSGATVHISGVRMWCNLVPSFVQDVYASSNEDLRRQDRPKIREEDSWLRLGQLAGALEQYAARFATDLSVSAEDVILRVNFCGYQEYKGRTAPHCTRPGPLRVGSRRKRDRPSETAYASDWCHAELGNAILVTLQEARASTMQRTAEARSHPGSQMDSPADTTPTPSARAAHANDTDDTDAGDGQARYQWSTDKGGTLERTLSVFGLQVGVVVPVKSPAGSTRGDAAVASSGTARMEAHPSAWGPGPGPGPAASPTMRSTEALADGGLDLSRERELPLLVFSSDDARGTQNAADTSASNLSVQHGQQGDQSYSGYDNTVSSVDDNEDDIGRDLPFSSGHAFDKTAYGGTLLASTSELGVGLPAGANLMRPTETSHGDLSLMPGSAASIEFELQLQVAASESSTSSRLADLHSRTRLDVHISTPGARVLMCPARLAGLAPLLAVLSLVTPVRHAGSRAAASEAGGGAFPAEPTKAPSTEETKVLQQLLATAAGVSTRLDDDRDSKARQGSNTPPLESSQLSGIVGSLGWLVGFPREPEAAAQTDLGPVVGHVDPILTGGDHLEFPTADSAPGFTFAVRTVSSRGAVDTETFVPTQNTNPGAGAMQDTMTSFMSFNSETSSGVGVQAVTDTAGGSSGRSSSGNSSSTLRKSVMVESSMAYSKQLEKSQHKALRLSFNAKFVQAVVFAKQMPEDASEAQPALVLSLGVLSAKQSESRLHTLVDIQIGYIEVDQESRNGMTGKSTTQWGLLSSDSLSGASPLEAEQSVMPIGGIAPIDGKGSAAIVTVALLREHGDDVAAVSVDVQLGQANFRIPKGAFDLRLDSFSSSFARVAAESLSALENQWLKVSDGSEAVTARILSSSRADFVAVEQLKLYSLGLRRITPPSISVALEGITAAVLQADDSCNQLQLSAQKLRIINNICPEAASTAPMQVSSASNWLKVVHDTTQLQRWTMDAVLVRLSTKNHGKSVAMLELSQDGDRVPCVELWPSPPLWNVPATGDGSATLLSTCPVCNCRGDLIQAARDGKGNRAARERLLFLTSVDFASATLFVNEIGPRDSQAIASLIRSPIFAGEGQAKPAPATRQASAVLIQASRLAALWKEEQLLLATGPSVELWSEMVLALPGGGEPPSKSFALTYIHGENLIVNAMLGLDSNVHGHIAAAIVPYLQLGETENNGHAAAETSTEFSPGLASDQTDHLPEDVLVIPCDTSVVVEIDRTQIIAAGESASLAVELLPLNARVSWRNSVHLESVLECSEIVAYLREASSCASDKREEVARCSTFKFSLLPQKAVREEEARRQARTHDLRTVTASENVRVYLNAINSRICPAQVAHIFQIAQQLGLLGAVPVKVGEDEDRIEEGEAGLEGADVVADDGAGPAPPRGAHPLQSIGFSPLTALMAGVDELRTKNGSISAASSSGTFVRLINGKKAAIDRLREAISDSRRFSIDQAVLGNKRHEIRRRIFESDLQPNDRMNSPNILDDFFSDAYASIGGAEPGVADVALAAASEPGGFATGSSTTIASIVLHGEGTRAREQVDLVSELGTKESPRSTPSEMANVELVPNYMVDADEGDDVDLAGAIADPGESSVRKQGEPSSGHEQDPRSWPGADDGEVFAALLHTFTSFGMRGMVIVDHVQLEVRLESSNSATGLRLALLAPTCTFVTCPEESTGSARSGAACFSIRHLKVEASTPSNPAFGLIRSPYVRGGDESAEMAVRITVARLGTYIGVSLQAAAVRTYAKHSSLTVAYAVVGALLAAARPGLLPRNADTVSKLESGNAASAITMARSRGSLDRIVQIHSAATSLHAAYSPGTLEPMSMPADAILIPAGVDTIARQLCIRGLKIPLVAVDWRDDIGLHDLRSDVARARNWGEGEREANAEDMDDIEGNPTNRGQVAGANAVLALLAKSWSKAVTAGQIASAVGALQHPVMPLHSAARLGGAIRSLALLPMTGVRMAVQGGSKVMRGLLGRENIPSQSSATPLVRASNRLRRGGGALFWSRKAGEAMLGLGSAVAIEALKAASNTAIVLQKQAERAERAMAGDQNGAGASADRGLPPRGERAIAESGGGDDGDGDSDSGSLVLAIRVGLGAGSARPGREAEIGSAHAVTRAVPVAVLRATAGMSGAIAELSQALRRGLESEAELAEEDELSE